MFLGNCTTKHLTTNLALSYMSNYVFQTLIDFNTQSWGSVIMICLYYDIVFFFYMLAAPDDFEFVKVFEADCDTYKNKLLKDTYLIYIYWLIDWLIEKVINDYSKYNKCFFQRITFAFFLFSLYLDIFVFKIQRHNVKLKHLSHYRWGLFVICKSWIAFFISFWEKKEHQIIDVQFISFGF